jgi:hypothetical protein
MPFFGSISDFGNMIRSNSVQIGNKGRFATEIDKTWESVGIPNRRWGIFTRKLRWGLSWQGRLLALLLAATTMLLAVKNVHPFLAVTHRLDCDVLVVEGWVHYFAIEAGANEFKNGGYKSIYTTGGPTTGSGGYTWDADTSASVGAGELRKFGVESVQMVPSHVIERDRTYYSAVALRDWFHRHQLEVRRLNVVTESVHARRTWLLFQEAFGNETEIGIIAVRNPDYDSKSWWRSSDGFRDVCAEAIAYTYARLFFHPDRSG